MSIEFGGNPTGVHPDSLDNIAAIITDWSFIDHGVLSGLGDDDHVQYHNATRGDIRYLYRENTDAFTPDDDYEPATKKYVDDLDYATFENALTKAGGTIKFGGLLTDDTAVDAYYDLKFGSATALKDFSVDADDITFDLTGNAHTFLAQYYAGAAVVQSQISISNYTAFLYAQEDTNNSTKLSVVADSSGGNWFKLETKISGTTYTVESDEGGLYCAGDYSGDYTTRHLVDKAYVDAQVATRDEFIELTDTPGSYTTDGAIYVADNSGTAVEESTVILTEAVNTFAITKGTASLTIAAAGSIDIGASAVLNLDRSLQVTTNAGILAFTGASKTLSIEDSAIVSQDYSADATPTFGGVILTTDLTLVNTVSEFSTDTTFAGNSDTAVPTEKAVKAYVDGASSGLDVKTPCRVATTGNVTIATALNNGDTIDGVTVDTNDRVFVIAQTNEEENGIYVVTGAPVRAADANDWDDELVQAYAFITAGTANAGSSWVCNITSGGTLDTDPIPVIQFSDATAYSAGNGLDLVGTTFSVDLKTNGGLAIDTTELKADVGTGATQVAAGDHTHGSIYYTETEIDSWRADLIDDSYPGYLVDWGNIFNIPATVANAMTSWVLDTDNEVIANITDSDKVTFSEGSNITVVRSGSDPNHVITISATGLVTDADFGNYTVLAADTASNPQPVTIQSEAFLGRKSTGGIVSLNPSEALTILGLSGFNPNNYLLDTTDTLTGTLTVTTGVTVPLVTIDGIPLENSTDRSGLLEINRKGSSTYAGLQTKFSSTALWSFMGTQTFCALYDDYNSNWILKYTEGSALELYHGDGVKKLATTGTGVAITGLISATTGLSGPNVTSGANPGHTHTGTSISGLSVNDTTSGTFSVSRGGTGLSTIATDRILTGNGASAMTAESGLTYNGSTLTVSGTVAATTVTGANVTSGANPGHTHTGSSISDLAAADITSGTFGVARGGTGLSTVGTNYLLTGNVTGALTAESTLLYSGGNLTVGNGIWNGASKMFYNEGHVAWITDQNDATPAWNFSTSHNLEWDVNLGSGTLSISNMVDGDTGVLIIENTSSGTLTLPATSDPATIAYTASAVVVATVVRWGARYLWSSKTTSVTPT